MTLITLRVVRPDWADWAETNGDNHRNARSHLELEQINSTLDKWSTNVWRNARLINQGFLIFADISNQISTRALRAYPEPAFPDAQWTLRRPWQMHWGFCSAAPNDAAWRKKVFVALVKLRLKTTWLGLGKYCWCLVKILHSNPDLRPSPHLLALESALSYIIWNRRRRLCFAGTLEPRGCDVKGSWQDVIFWQAGRENRLFLTETRI